MMKLRFSRLYQKLSYVALIGGPGLSSKEKDLKHSRGRNFDLIIPKLGTNVGFIKVKIELVDELCEAKRSSNTFLQKNTVILSSGRNFDPIVYKLDSKVGLVKILIKVKEELCEYNRCSMTFLKKCSFLNSSQYLYFAL